MDGTDIGGDPPVAGEGGGGDVPAPARDPDDHPGGDPLLEDVRAAAAARGHTRVEPTRHDAPAGDVPAGAEGAGPNGGTPPHHDPADDPIVEEVRAARRTLFSATGDDVVALFRRARASRPPARGAKGGRATGPGTTRPGACSRRRTRSRAPRPRPPARASHSTRTPRS